MFDDEIPCCEHNPALWRIFCTITKRDPTVPNYNWTEKDVAKFILEKVGR